MTIQFWCGDVFRCLEIVESNSIDCAIVDPPYGDTSLVWDKRINWPGELRRVLKLTGSIWVFGSMRMFLESASHFAGWKFSHDIVWEKHNGTNMFNDRFRRVHEHVLHFYRDDAKWCDVYKQTQFTLDATARTVRRKQRPVQWGDIGEGSYESHDGGPRMTRSVIRVRSEHGRAVHPTQKPEGIVEPLLLYSCPPGGTVLDPFSGAGTTALVASRLGRRSLNFEINPEYVALAKARLAASLLTVGRPQP